MAYPVEEKEYFAEADAVLVSLDRSPIPRTIEMVRKWNHIDDKLSNSVQRAVDEYTSAGNASPSFSVTNPTAAGPRGLETHTGKWRGVRVFKQASEPDSLFQTLRLGYLSHGTSGNPLDQAESRLGRSSGKPATGDQQVEQQWRYCDPADHEEILADLTAIKTVTDPSVDGQTMTGLFAVSEVRCAPNEDGSLFVSRVLTEMFTLDDTGDLASILSLQTRQQELINRFGFEPGDEEKLLSIYPAISPASETYAMDTLTPANLETHIGGTWTFVDRKFNEKPDGTAEFLVLYMQETWDATYSADRKSVQGSTVSGYLRSLLVQVTGSDRTQALSDFDTITAEGGAAFSAGTNYNIGDPVVYSGTDYIFIEVHPAGAWNANHVVDAEYLLNGRNVAERGRGEFSVSGNMTSVYNGVLDADAVIVFQGDPNTEFDRYTMRRVWYRRSEAAKDTLVTAGSGKARSSFVHETKTFGHQSYQVQDHGDGGFTVRQNLGEFFDETHDPMLIRIRPNITEYEQKMIARVWKHLTEAGKDALIASGGVARSDLTFETVLYTHGDVFVEDGEKQGYSVRQVLIEQHTGTTTATALILRLRAGVNETRLVQRVWLHVTTAAKNTLMTAGSAARTNDTIEGVVYTHADARAEDLGHGAYNVVQTLTDQTGTWVSFFEEEVDVVKLYTRTRDDKTRTITYIRHVKVTSTERQGWQWIDGLNGTPTVLTKVVAGSDTVVKTSAGTYRAKCLTLDHTPTTGGIGAWT